MQWCIAVFVISQDSGNLEGTKAAVHISRKIAPFACKVIVKPTELSNKKCDKVTVDGIYLHPDVNISGAHVIAILDDHMCIDRVSSFATFKFVKENGRFMFPFVGIHLTAQDREWIGVTELNCSSCGKSRWVRAKDQKTLEKRTLTCGQLRGLNCDSPLGEAGIPVGVRRGRPNKKMSDGGKRGRVVSNRTH